jgi:hypothetical protein
MAMPWDLSKRNGATMGYPYQSDGPNKNKKGLDPSLTSPFSAGTWGMNLPSPLGCWGYHILGQNHEIGYRVSVSSEGWVNYIYVVFSIYLQLQTATGIESRYIAEYFK